MSLVNLPTGRWRIREYRITVKPQIKGREKEEKTVARVFDTSIPPIHLTSRRFPSFPTHYLLPRPILVPCASASTASPAPPPPLPSSFLDSRAYLSDAFAFVGLREVSRGETSSSRAEWISRDYLVAPNRSESGHNGTSSHRATHVPLSMHDSDAPLLSLAWLLTIGNWIRQRDSIEWKSRTGSRTQ